MRRSEEKETFFNFRRNMFNLYQMKIPNEFHAFLKTIPQDFLVVHQRISNVRKNQ